MNLISRKSAKIIKKKFKGCQSNQDSENQVFISHTGCMDLYKNVRNTADANLRKLAGKRGLVGSIRRKVPILSMMTGRFI